MRRLRAAWCSVLKRAEQEVEECTRSKLVEDNKARCAGECSRSQEVLMCRGVASGRQSREDGCGKAIRCLVCSLGSKGGWAAVSKVVR